MKTWQVVLVVGAVVLIGAVLIMKAQTPKANPLNSAFGTPTGSQIGLAAAAGLGGLLGTLLKPSGNPAPINQGTYQVGINPVVTGNTLTDPNTGKELVYGTD